MDWKPPVPQEQLGRELVKRYHIRKLDDCYVCHR
jgi:hypothetical protein